MLVSITMGCNRYQPPFTSLHLYPLPHFAIHSQYNRYQAPHAADFCVNDLPFVSSIAIDTKVRWLLASKMLLDASVSPAQPSHACCRTNRMSARKGVGAFWPQWRS